MKKAILITGVPGSGKSTVANNLFRAPEIIKSPDAYRVIGTDTIREVVKSVLSIDFYPEIHGSSIDFCDKNDISDIHGFLKQSELLAPAIKAVIKRNREEGRHVILEGIHFLPEHYVDLKNVYHFILKVPSRSEHEKRLSNQTRPHFKKKKKIQNIDRYKYYQKHLINSSEKYNNVIVLENINVKSSVDFILGYIQ